MIINDILLELELYGYAVIKENVIKKKLLNNLVKLHETLLNDDSNYTDKDYYGGYLKKWHKDFLSEKSSEISQIEEFTNSKIVHSIIDTNRYKKYKLHSIFATLDRKKTKHIAQDPHFDRMPTLKFMLYLNDMDKNNGAFMLSPGSQHWVKKNFKFPRPAFVSKKFLEDTRTIPQIIIDNLKPIEGKAGTVIIFDTDTIHHQGLVKNGESRIMRFHFSSSERLNKYGSLREKIGTIAKDFRNKIKYFLK